MFHNLSQSFTNSQTFTLPLHLQNCKPLQIHKHSNVMIILIIIPLMWITQNIKNKFRS